MPTYLCLPTACLPACPGCRSHEDMTCTLFRHMVDEYNLDYDKQEVG